MKYELQRNGVEIGVQEEKLIQRKLEKLDRLLEHFNEDLVFLRIYLDKIEKRHLYNVRLVLEVPNHNLRAEKQGKDLVGVTNETFDALFREVNKLKEFLRREPEYRRRQRPSYKEKLAQVDLTGEIQETFEEMVEKNLPRLYNFALREIQHQIYQGFIKPGDISVPDVLDEAIVRVSRELPAELEEQWVRRQLYRRTIQVIREWIRERRIRVAPLEKKLEPTDIDTELYEYYQPDDVVRLEDVIPDSSAFPPDEVVEEDDIMLAIDHALSLLPNDWRQAFSMVEVEGFTPEEVAMIQGKPEDQINKEVEMTREFLKGKLAEMGFKWRV